jgi:hypothetical protein
VSASSGCHRDFLLPSEGLGHGVNSAGRLLVPPSFTLIGGPFFVGSVVEESTPAVTPFTSHLATTPA